MGMLVAAVALAATLVQPAAAPAVREPAAFSARPQTLYASPRGTIQAFAQDGPLIAWFAPSRATCNAVNVLSLANGARALLPNESAGAPNVTCRWEVVQPVRLALARAGADALWTLREVGPLPYDYVLGAGLSDTTERRFQEVAHSPKGPGLWLGGVAGDAATLVYSVTTVAYEDEVGCLANGGSACNLKVTGGGIYRIVGRKRLPLVPDSTAAVAIAVSDDTVAYVPAATVGKGGAPIAAGDLPIEVRDVRSGVLISRVMPQGTPLAIALSGGVLATLERTPLGVALAWYDPASGARRGSVPVSARVAPELTASDQLIVYRVGRSIRAVNTRTSKVSTLARAAAAPIGLSLEGSRLAWAENVRGKGRIRAVYVRGRG